MNFKAPTIALAMTLHDRTPATLKRVLAALRQNPVDQLVIALDRTEAATLAALDDFEVPFTAVPLAGPPGWRCSASAWNAAFAEVSTELLVCISSDVELAPGATTALRDRLAAYPAVMFGKCLEEAPETGDQLAKGLTYKVLCSSREPRPLGFVMGMPMWLVRTTGGYDEGLMGGIWYEDSDWCQRLWLEGVPFVFDDAVRGTHISHSRPLLDTPEGARLQGINMQWMIKRWGSLEPFNKNQFQLKYERRDELPAENEGVLYMLQSLEQGNNTVGEAGKRFTYQPGEK